MGLPLPSFFDPFFCCTSLSILLHSFLFVFWSSFLVLFPFLSSLPPFFSQLGAAWGFRADEMNDKISSLNNQGRDDWINEWMNREVRWNQTKYAQLISIVFFLSWGFFFRSPFRRLSSSVAPLFLSCLPPPFFPFVFFLIIRLPSSQRSASMGTSQLLSFANVKLYFSKIQTQPSTTSGLCLTPLRGAFTST